MGFVMKKVVGFKFTTNEIHYVVLEKTDSIITIIDKETISHPSNKNPGEFCDWAE
jgi:hypothetical protein